MTGKRRSKRYNKGAGSNGKFVLSLLPQDLPSFNLLSQSLCTPVSPIKIVKRRKNASKQASQSGLALENASGDSYISAERLVDSSTLGKHSEVVLSIWN